MIPGEPTPTLTRPARIIEGIVPPIITPLRADGELDRVGLERQVRRLLDAGVHGLFALGSTGETAYLPGRTRLAVADIVTSMVDGAVPVVVGAIEPSPARVAEFVSALDRRRISAIVATAPFYGRTHVEEVKAHYRSIAQLGLPVLAYDVPVAVHVQLADETVIELGADGTIAGLKDSTGLDARTVALLEATKEIGAFSVLTGSETTVDRLLGRGVHGAVPGLANIDPSSYTRIWACVRAGRLDDAHSTQSRLVRIMAIADVGAPERMGRGSAGVGSFKVALFLMGVIESPAVAAPLIPLSDGEVDKIRGILTREGVL